MVAIHQKYKLAAITSLTGQDTPEACCAAPCNSWAASHAQLTRSGSDHHCLGHIISFNDFGFLHKFDMLQVSERVYRVLDQQLEGVCQELLPPSMLPLQERLQQAEGALQCMLPFLYAWAELQRNLLPLMSEAEVQSCTMLSLLST